MILLDPKWAIAASVSDKNACVKNAESVHILGGRNGNPLQDSCLENSMDRGAWWATVHGIAKKSHTNEET